MFSGAWHKTAPLGLLLWVCWLLLCNSKANAGLDSSYTGSDAFCWPGGHLASSGIERDWVKLLIHIVAPAVGGIFCHNSVKSPTATSPHRWHINIVSSHINIVSTPVRSAGHGCWHFTAPEPVFGFWCWVVTMILHCCLIFLIFLFFRKDLILTRMTDFQSISSSVVQKRTCNLIKISANWY